MMRALVLFSGGVDSTTCLAIAVNKYGKEFLDNLDKTRNPKLINKYLKKLLRKKKCSG